MKVKREELRAGDQFTATVPQYRGKPRPVTYIVTGHAAYRGRPYVTVRSAVQGEGSMLLAAMPELLEVTR